MTPQRCRSANQRLLELCAQPRSAAGVFNHTLPASAQTAASVLCNCTPNTNIWSVVTGAHAMGGEGGTIQACEEEPADWPGTQTASEACVRTHVVAVCWD